jgi:hypothetical protein
MTPLLALLRTRIRLIPAGVLSVLVLSAGLFFLIFEYTSAQFIGVEEPAAFPIGPPPQNTNNPGNPNAPGYFIPLPTNPTGVAPGTPAPAPAPGTPAPEAGAAEAAAAADTAAREPQVVVLGTGFLNDLYGFVLTFGRFIVGVSGKLLDFAIENFILKFGEIYNSWGVGVAINKGWSTVRDVLNLSFIFALVYIGLKLIFNADDSSAKRSLGYLLVAALLINFSLFISKFVIDLANSLASIIYYQGLSNATQGISSVLMGMLGISTIMNIPVTDVSALGTAGGLAVIFGTFIFLLIMAYVLFAFAIMILIRAIILFFLMIFSPIMFLGFIFSDFMKYSRDYMSKLLGNAFFAPAVIFMLYLSVSIMQHFKIQFSNDAAGQASLGYLFSSNDYDVGMQAFLVFSIGIGLLLLSLSVAKRMGAAGASTAISVGDSLRKRGQNALKWGAGQSLQPFRWGSRIASDRVGLGVRTGLSNLQTRNRGVLGAIARTSLAEQYIGGAATSMRNAQMGTGQTQTQKDAKTRAARTAVNNRVTIADGIAAGPGTPEHNAMLRLAAGMSSKDLEAMNQAERMAIAPFVTASTAEGLAKSDKVDAGDIENFQNERRRILRESIENMGMTMSRDFSRLSISQLEEIGEDYIAANADNLTDDQLKAMKSSKRFTPAQVAGFEETKRTRLEMVGTGLVPDLAFQHTFIDTAGVRQVENKTPKEIAALPASVLTHRNAVPYLNARSLQEIQSANKLTRRQVARIISNIGTGPGDAYDYINSPKAMSDGYWRL